jgi:HK97 family phage prohead protease
VTTERRSVNLVDAEVKGRMFRGYAAVFDTPWSEELINATGYVEKVARGMFRKALGNTSNVPFLLEHAPLMLLATTKSGNLRVKEDGPGLLTEAKLPDNHLGEYARSMVDSGDMKGMSYGVELYPKKDTMLSKEGNVWVRTVTSARRLLDVSLTWQPAYTATTAELRSTGFVATPLQELLGGPETQTEPAAAEESPDEQESWWGDEPDPDSTPAEGSKPWWESYIDQLEKEY